MGFKTRFAAYICWHLLQRCLQKEADEYTLLAYRTWYTVTVSNEWNLPSFKFKTNLCDTVALSSFHSLGNHWSWTFLQSAKVLVSTFAIYIDIICSSNL